MIGQVSPLNLSTQAMNPLGPLSQPEATPGDAAIGGPAPLLSSVSDAISALQINTAVGQLLQGIGGGAESNQTLQMLIALLILVTLLQGQSNNSAAGTLDDLAQGGIGRGGYLGVTMSSTTVTIEQTSIIYSESGAADLGGAGEAGSNPGRQLDLAA